SGAGPDAERDEEQIVDTPEGRNGGRRTRWGDHGCHTPDMSLGGLGGDTASVVAALRAVPGVADAEILPDPSGGPGTLRLQLAPGADEVLVATAVHRGLGEPFGLGVDAGRVAGGDEAGTRPG